MVVDAQRPAERRIVSPKAITTALFRPLCLFLSRQEVSKPEVLGTLTVILFFPGENTSVFIAYHGAFGHVGSEWFPILGTTSSELG